ncbi:MAG: acetyl-CoA hydrolase/transferase C-terminal domain-containing protein, partial [Persicimonas sp.]
MARPQIFDDCEDTTDAIIAHVGPRISLALPLGLGKPNHLVNALVRRAIAGDIEDLEIFTALSLGKPSADNELQRRLMEPVTERLFAGYEDLDYVGLLARSELPEHIRVHEFFFPPGAMMSSRQAQQAYKSVNYTHALREILAADIDLVGQLVAPGLGDGYNLSCNTDISVDLFERLRARDQPPLLVGQVNRRLPAMGGRAEVSPETFDIVLDDPSYDYDLYAMPSVPPDDAEYMIGLRTAALLKDGGTIQVGIGNLGEAICWAATLRDRQPEEFERLLDAGGLTPQNRELIEREGGTGPFEEGLYASTEMLVEGIMQLYNAGVLKRRVFGDLETQQAANRGDVPTSGGVVAHGGFFLGSPRFYDILRDLGDEGRADIAMTGVRFTNLLYGDEELKRAQRQHARFINETMKITLLGAAVSDALGDGRVVSGVGGQYEFVAMGNELDGARSILNLVSTRGRGDSAESNIVWNYAHTTIPRHLRDIVVTEYGVADLRGKSDRKIVEELIPIADARFQDELVEQARDAGKLPADYEVPEHARQNTP